MTSQHDKPAGGAGSPAITADDLAMGDRVTVWATVVTVQAPSSFILELDGRYGDNIQLPITAIATHAPKPRPLKVGDRVTYRGPDSNPPRKPRGELISIHPPAAWVLWDGAIVPATVNFDALEHAQ